MVLVARFAVPGQYERAADLRALAAGQVDAVRRQEALMVDLLVYLQNAALDELLEVEAKVPARVPDDPSGFDHEGIRRPVGDQAMERCQPSIPLTSGRRHDAD